MSHLCDNCETLPLPIMRWWNVIPEYESFRARYDLPRFWPPKSAEQPGSEAGTKSTGSGGNEDTGTDECQLCLFLIDVISRVLEEDGSARLAASEVAGVSEAFAEVKFDPEMPWKGKWKLRFRSGTLSIGNYESKLEIGIDEGFEDIVGEYVLSPSCIEKIKSWIKACADSQGDHELCPKAATSQPPLRLLDTTKDEIVPLVENIERDVCYAALSYCWGDSSEARRYLTTLDNIDERLRDGILASHLPATIRDAISLCRGLDIPFIWVDAICIVQGSDEWKTESTRMMEYYENSYLTVVPTMSSKASDQFLNRTRRVTRVLKSADPERSPVTLQYPIFKSPDVLVITSAWNSRGWTLQERQLSSRCLFLTEDWMRYECRHGYSNEGRYRESSPESSQAYSFLPRFPKGIARLWRRPRKPRGSGPSSKRRKPLAYRQKWRNCKHVREMWINLIWQYSRRKLTRETDRLVALSGIASKFQQALGKDDEYIDGFWKNDFGRVLAWRRPNPGLCDSSRRASSAIFPSWSWLSFDAQVYFPLDCYRENAVEILDSKRDEVGGIEVVRVLVLKGWFFSMTKLKREPGAEEIKIHSDYPESLVQFSEHHSQVYGIIAAIFPSWPSSFWPDDVPVQPHGAAGILVVESTESPVGGVQAYRRVGTFDIFTGDFPLIREDIGPVSNIDNVANIFRFIYASEKDVITLV